MLSQSGVTKKNQRNLLFSERGECLNEGSRIFLRDKKGGTEKPVIWILEHPTCWHPVSILHESYALGLADHMEAFFCLFVFSSDYAMSLWCNKPELSWRGAGIVLIWGLSACFFFPLKHWWLLWVQIECCT